MALHDLSVSAICVVGFIFFLICLVSVICAVRAFDHKKRGMYLLCTLPITAVSFLFTGAINVWNARINRHLPTLPYTERFLSLPLWILITAGLLCTALLAAIAVRLSQTRRQALSAQSLCEGLDQLPDGICCSMPDGFPRMVNDQMQRISNAAFGIGILDVKQLRSRLRDRDFLPGCTADERNGNLFLRLPDGSVWQLKRQSISVGNRDLSETIAYNVTRRYNDLCELEQRNRKLEAVNRQIREISRNMDRIVREKEILAAKIRLHGNLGQCLLAIQSYLTGGEGSRESVTRELEQTVSLLRNNTADENTEDRMYALQEAARTVGVALVIRGEIPPQWKEIIEIAVHECLTNTVKHANGNLLEIAVREENGTVTVELTNDGKPPAGEIRETGGLKILRALAEQRGGRMEIESEPRFRLVLRF